MAAIEIVISQAGNPPPGGYTFGSREDITTGTAFQLNNSPTGNAGVIIWFWEIIDQPTASNLLIVAPANPIQVLTALVAGSYLFELTVQTSDQSFTGRVRVGIESVTQLRTTAAGETTEANLQTGWAKNQQLNVERLSGQQYARDLFATATVSSIVIGSDPGAPVSVTETNHLATKAYVDSVATGLDPKQNVRMTTHGTVVDLTAGNSPSNVDGLVVVTNDRIAVTTQGGEPAGAHLANGIYVATNAGTGANDGTWTRATDADEDAEVTAGLYFTVSEGTFEGWEFILVTPDPITVGVTALEFAATPVVTQDRLYDTVAGTAIRNLVYLSGVDAVTATQANAEATMPGIGFVVSKPTATSCRVRSGGELGGFAGLVAGNTLFADDAVAGNVVTVAPSGPGTVIQKVAKVKNATTIVVLPDQTTVVN